MCVIIYMYVEIQIHNSSARYAYIVEAELGNSHNSFSF